VLPSRRYPGPPTGAASRPRRPQYWLSATTPPPRVLRRSVPVIPLHGSRRSPARAGGGARPSWHRPTQDARLARAEPHAHGGASTSQRPRCLSALSAERPTAPAERAVSVFYSAGPRPLSRPAVCRLAGRIRTRAERQRRDPRQRYPATARGYPRPASMRSVRLRSRSSARQPADPPRASARRRRDRSHATARRLASPPTQLSDRIRPSLSKWHARRGDNRPPPVTPGFAVAYVAHFCA